MLWSSLLINCSIYLWFLFFQMIYYPELPAFWSGAGSFVYITLLPSLLAYGLNSLITAFERTVIKVIIINGFTFLIMAVITSFVTGIFLNDFLRSGILLSSVGNLAPLAWQAASWAVALFLSSSLVSKQEEHGDAYHQFSISLLITIPALLFLTWAEFQLFPLEGIIMIWFALLAASLTLEGNLLGNDADVRYDLLFFHFLIPAVSALTIYFFAFTDHFWSALNRFRQMLQYLWEILLSLLTPSNLPEAVIPPEPVDPGYVFEQEAARGVSELSVIFTYLLYIVGAIAGLMALFLIISWFMTRLESNPGIRSKKNINFLSLLQGLCQFIVFFINQTFRLIVLGFLKLWVSIKTSASWLHKVIRRLLPPLSPEDSIRRCYNSFQKMCQKKTKWKRKSYETSLEYIKRIRLINSDEVNLLTGPKGEELVFCYLEMEFSSINPDWQQSERCKILLKAIKTGLSDLKKKPEMKKEIHSPDI